MGCEIISGLHILRIKAKKKAKKGTNIAVVALARKVLCVLHHLLTVQEMYKGEVKDRDDAVEDIRYSKAVDLTGRYDSTRNKGGIWGATLVIG